MPRLFVAAWPDEPTRRVLASLPRPDEPGVRWVSAPNWHVTLRFLGEVDRDEADARLRAGAAPAAAASLGPAVAWLGPQLVVPVGGVDELAAWVRRATADLGPPAPHRFRGHLTVARTRRGASSAVAGHPCRAAFTVEEIALVRSDLHPDGARYETVATYPAR